jgi:hypothetical protein
MLQDIKIRSKIYKKIEVPSAFCKYRKNKGPSCKKVSIKSSLYKAHVLKCKIQGLILSLIKIHGLWRKSGYWASTVLIGY